MLPDFPGVKKHVRQQHLQIMTNAMHAGRGVLSNIPIRPVREGRQTGIVRPTGKRDDITMHKLQVSETIPADAAETWTNEQVIAHYEKLGREMGEKQAKMTFREIDKAVEEVGNVISVNGPLGPEVFFAMIEKVRLDFDSEGKARFPTIIAHPNQAEAWKRAGELMKQDPANEKKFNELLERKRLEWIERESSRKLVD